MRLHVQQGEAYRSEIQEVRWQRDRARADLQRWADSLAPGLETWRDFTDGRLYIRIEVAERVMRNEPEHELLLLIRDSIMRRLTESGRDYRGDLRQTSTQRALGL